MADAFQKQLDTDEAAALSFEERLGLLVDTEWTAREQRKLQRRLQTAKLRYPASLEAVDFTRARQLNRQQVLTLGTCAWIAERHNLIITGPYGIGKSFLCCALVERACRRGFTARYVRMPRLLHELAVGRGDGSYTRLLARLAKLDLLAIDDWMLAPLRDPDCTSDALTTSCQRSCPLGRQDSKYVASTCRRSSIRAPTPRWNRYGWAVRSRLDPVKKVARMLKRHLDGVLRCVKHPITNSVAEGLNSKIMGIKRKAGGFRNPANFTTAI